MRLRPVGAGRETAPSFPEVEPGILQSPPSGNVAKFHHLPFGIYQMPFSSLCSHRRVWMNKSWQGGRGDLSHYVILAITSPMMAADGNQRRSYFVCRSVFELRQSRLRPSINMKMCVWTGREPQRVRSDQSFRNVQRASST